MDFDRTTAKSKFAGALNGIDNTRHQNRPRATSRKQEPSKLVFNYFISVFTLLSLFSQKFLFHKCSSTSINISQKISMKLCTIKIKADSERFCKLLFFGFVGFLVFFFFFVDHNHYIFQFQLFCDAKQSIKFLF